MIIMKAGATVDEVRRVLHELHRYGVRADVSHGEFRTTIRVVGDESKVPFPVLASLPGVKEAAAVEAPYRLINREYSDVAERQITVRNVTVGGGGLTYIAGPCAVESKQQVFQIAEGVKAAGAHMLRGGVFKPRSSVHSFQGLGSTGLEEAEEALGWLREAGRRFELPVVTEVRGEAQVGLVARYADVLQIGSRNMYNQDLLAKVAGMGKPVLFKRHFGAGIEEFLSFAEYLAAEGNKDIVLCERGILPPGKGRDYTRYVLDLSAVPVVKRETFLPIIVDPSHATGRRDLIFGMSCAAVAAGADGLMIEAHCNPSESLVDGPQIVTPDELGKIIQTCEEIHRLVGRGKT